MCRCSAGKPASFGNPASGFGASSGFDGFNFSATHPDAGGGVGGGQSHRTVFGTSTSSNQFSFSSADTNQMNNAATFRPAFGAEPSTANISQGTVFSFTYFLFLLLLAYCFFSSSGDIYWVVLGKVSCTIFKVYGLGHYVPYGNSR